MGAEVTMRVNLFLIGMADNSDYESERSDEYSGDSDDSGPVINHQSSLQNRRAPIAPQPTLTNLQRAWSTEVNTATTGKYCAQCFSIDASRRCSRCTLTWYCNTTCQTLYHPIHKLECIDAAKHASVWGIFDGKKSDGGIDNLIVLKARRNAKRRKY